MPIELSRDDLMELDCLRAAAPATLARDKVIFRADLAAGIERAAKVFEQDPKPLITPGQAAAAIRALLK